MIPAIIQPKHPTLSVEQFLAVKGCKIQLSYPIVTNADVMSHGGDGFGAKLSIPQHGLYPIKHDNDVSH